MSTQEGNQNLFDRIAALREKMVDQLSAQLIENPQLADELTKQIDEMLEGVITADLQQPPPPDKGLAELVGLGPEAAVELGETRLPHRVTPYDETVTSERILAVGDLYYIYQHERSGVFDTILKLQELFKAGSVRLSSGAGAFGLYQFDRRQVLRYTKRDRIQAYIRVFGYAKGSPMTGASPNRDFHQMFQQFVVQIAQFFRDKRISEVIRSKATDPSYGSIAIVRRAGLDLRNNLKNASYGHINVLRVELLQLLDEAFRILGAEDVKKLFGADHAWDVVEEVMRRYLNRTITASPRSRMAINGRDLLRWLAQPHILNSTRAEFEALLLQVSDDAEEWLTSSESLGITRPQWRTLATTENKILPRAQATEWEQPMFMMN